jgi:hypothetical protein
MDMQTDATHDLQAATTGRTIKFTPERIEQIRNLVERGKTREEIAEIVGSTVGSLQVTCSRLGISLRISRPKPPMRPKTEARMEPNGIVVAMPPQPKPRSENGATISLIMRARDGRVRETPLSLDSDAVVKLMLEAHIRGMSLPEFVGSVIRDFVRDQALLDRVAPLRR